MLQSGYIKKQESGGNEMKKFNRMVAMVLVLTLMAGMLPARAEAPAAQTAGMSRMSNLFTDTEMLAPPQEFTIETPWLEMTPEILQAENS